MVAKKPRIVIIGAGMAGLSAANKLHTVTSSRDLFDLCVVEGGSRIGGRINTSQFCGDRVEMGATWIHGIGGSPLHNIAQKIHSLESEQPWECMDGNGNNPDDQITIAEGGFKLHPSIVQPITTLFKTLMDHAQGKNNNNNNSHHEDTPKGLSIGSFLRKGLDAYWGLSKEEQELKGYYGNWSRKLLEEAIFAMHENSQRTYTSAGELLKLDYSAESEYQMFPGEEITIAKGYFSIIEYLASVLPPGVVQLGKKVNKIEWQPERVHDDGDDDGSSVRPVKIHFCDGSDMYADHVIVTVSLGVLKAESSAMFCPHLPPFKAEAIKRLGFGTVNKLFMQLKKPITTTTTTTHDETKNFPFLQLVFHSPQSEMRLKKIPWWMRRSPTLCPIYKGSSVLLCWFAGDEALELESLEDEEIIHAASDTFSTFLSHKGTDQLKFNKVLKTQWGTDPLFLGSYSYVAVGSRGDDFDTMAEPLPKGGGKSSSSAAPPPLQILFAGEATHRTHYSTTHGAYFSGLREANRLLQHYHCVGIH